MKNILVLIFLVFSVISCTPIRYVNVERKHNYYQRHRTTTYTTPIWIPNHGIVLQTHRMRKPNSQHHVKRGKH